MVKIRFARNSDKQAITRFLKEHWGENSILVRSSEIFDFQYCQNNQCHFIIAVDDEVGKVFGLKGFIPFNSDKKPDIAAALAIVLPGVRPMLGMEIQRFLEKETNCRWLCSTGINPNTSVKVYRLFKDKYVVDTLNHYYRLADRLHYKVAVVKEKRIFPSEKGSYTLMPIKDIDTLKTVFSTENYRYRKPYKDLAYLNHRYFNHPFYNYIVFGLIQKGSTKAEALIFAREVQYNRTKVLRIVDYIGAHKSIGQIGGGLDKLLKVYEYIDFYCYGIKREYLNAAGFTLRDKSDPNIIPNYFEPFEQKNVDIFFFSTGADNATVCKADGDQDRPNLLPEEIVE